MTIAVSSWALHRTIGVSYPDSPATGPLAPTTHSVNPTDLLALPRLLAEHGYRQMQLCHFHLPSRSDEYAARFREALGEAGVELLSLLIDEGDITHPQSGRRDADWIAGWIETAHHLGAKRARVIAGKQPYSPETLDRAVSHIERLVALTDVRIDTENWFGFTSAPAPTNELLDRLEGRLGLCADFGNWDRPAKYETLPEIMPRAETIHAKCEIDRNMTIDAADYRRCLDIARSAAFDGPYVLVNGGPSDEWEAIRLSAEFIRDAIR
jgi:sugar phosphate isomerase/epimerase